MSLNRQKFMNIAVDNATLNEVLEHIEYCIDNQIVGQIIPLNVDQIVRLETDKYFKEICNNCELLLIDGHPLMWIAKAYGVPFKEKICGSDLVPILCKRAVEKGYSVFFLGAAPGVAKIAAEKMKHKYSGLKVAGTYSPPFGFEKDEEEVKKINYILKNSGADILFVGMGVPKQEIFIYENMWKYNIPISLSVGATIDFIAGKQKRAPKWINRIGFEWLYRLIHDPGRLCKRYLIDDMEIFRLAWKYRKQVSGGYEK